MMMVWVGGSCVRVRRRGVANLREDMRDNHGFSRQSWRRVGGSAAVRVDHGKRANDNVRLVVLDQTGIQSI